MIGLGLPGRPRPWKLAAAVTALQRAFPGREVFTGTGRSWWHRSASPSARTRRVSMR